MEYKIDASGKILGRLASEAAMLLRGKNSPSFDPSKMSKNRVIIGNAGKIRVSGKKLEQKLYRRHSGYHGGLKEENLQKLMVRDPRLAVRRAVMGMLPKNKLRNKIIKNLVFTK